MDWKNERYVKEVFNTLSKERDVEEILKRFKRTSKETIVLKKEDFSLPYDPTEEQREKEIENGIITIERPDINNRGNGRLRK